jgi:single-strand DNA-binding protein
MNKAILIGRLTKDPVGGEKYKRFTLAVDRAYKKDGKAETDFISCVTFGKTAEFTEKYLKTGTKVAVTGAIQTGSYKKDGKTIYTTDVRVDEIEFAEPKKAQEEPQEAPEFLNIPEGIENELPFK